MRRCGLFLLCVALTSLTLDGQVASSSRLYDPVLFSGLEWRNIGPNRGGRSLTVAGSPGRPYEFYAGAVGGGLWKTTDGGTTWAPVTDGQIKSSSVGAVAVSESNPDVVYIGMGEAHVQRNMLQGDGVYKSVDAGKTWSHIGLGDTQTISRIRIHPINPDLVYVAAFGHFYGPNDERGVYRSKDGGKSWQQILFRNNRSGAVDLVMARQNPDILFAAIWQASVGPGAGVSSGGPGSGLFKSTNGGDTWSEITRNPGLPSSTIGSIGLAVADADANRVYAIIEADGGGIFRSEDGGATWTKVNEEGPLRQRPSYFNHIHVDPKDKDVVYVLNLNFFKSTDGARTFRTIPTRHADHHDLWIAPNDSPRMVIATDGGPSVSFNGGETWTRQAIPTAQLYRVATTRDIPYHVCGAQQDQAALCLPSTQSPWRSVSPYVGTGADEGRLGGWMYVPGGGEFGMIAPHPRDPDLFFATGPSVVTRHDRRTGLSTARDIQVSPVAARGPDRERFSLYALAFSHHEPYVLYTASQHLWRTADGGLKWERISPDLSRPGTSGQSRRAVGSISTVAPSYHDANTIWAGTDDGLVHITRDGGKTWQKITPPELPEFSRVSLIEASPNTPGAAYVAVKRFELDDRAPYIFKTGDYGRSWQKIVNGIPSKDFVNVVREDPKRAGLLYAATDHTVHVSFDDGANWQSLALNLPDTSVSDLVVEANDLVIATQGRSFYILDDIGPLRELTPDVAASALHLFKPRDTIRRLNLPVIDYVLKAPASKVVMEILDAGGKVIRTYASGEENGKIDRDYAGRPIPRPSRGAGLNRFTWDLRYDGATVFPGLVMWVGTPDGPIAAPGAYQVRLTADGETRTQPLTVVRDPRQPALTDADLQAQFELALKARDGINAAHETVILIRRIKGQVQDRTAKARDSQITSAGDSLNTELSAVEGELYQVRLRSVLDGLPYMLNQHFANLKLSIETGDGRPTSQAYASYERLKSELDAHLAKLNDVLRTELPRFNRLLADRKLAPVNTSN
jgi:photosystem II stability/assembly factor-like uncharacterized protein